MGTTDVYRMHGTPCPAHTPQWAGLQAAAPVSFSFSMATGTTKVLTIVLRTEYYLSVLTVDGLEAPLYLVAFRNSRSSFPRPSLHFHQLSKKSRGPNPTSHPFLVRFPSLPLFFDSGFIPFWPFFFSFPLKQSFTPAPSRVMVRLGHRNCQALSPMTRPMRG
ncbi:hypothetical protein BO82DRAFT_119302 [Aspergillus uvarum CBS 121591]|uniref:Uncharacterized protein n=1 Tax=Aspergillus uvarum CBS 121591 TaxID=1448315 RepID=A0A319C8B6_9EURO|nr:hypothetical protein BO82DRAFT_119302 [Aspergillus uvarum CBS 121591]PYH79997.1 hypothetical protein BO82DRAFT_119302 [Aspergillus uvarum CBS 121591]